MVAPSPSPLHHMAGWRPLLREILDPPLWVVVFTALFTKPLSSVLSEVRTTQRPVPAASPIDGFKGWNGGSISTRQNHGTAGNREQAAL